MAYTIFNPDWWRTQARTFSRRVRTEPAGVSPQRKPDAGQRTYGQGGPPGYYDGPLPEKSNPWASTELGRTLNFPGYSDPLPPSYETYRYLLLDSTVQLARSQLIAPIRSIDWDLEADEGVSEDRVKFIEKMIRYHRNGLVREAMRALDYGWSPFEVVWGREEGRYTINQFKPLLVDITNVVIDTRGQFAGLEQPRTAFAPPGADNGVYLPTNRSMVFTFDGEAGNWYGRPLLENVRFAVSNWLSENVNAGKLSNRATGVFAVIKFPPGTGLDEMGREVKRIAQATALGDKLLNGDGFVCLENYAGINIKGLVNAADLAKLAEASMWHVDILDFGDVGESMDEVRKNKEYLDHLKVRGYLIPEGSVLSSGGSGGGKLDSEVQTASSTLNAQLIAGDLIETVNDELDDVSEFNWGMKARRTIRIKNPLLEAKQVEIDKMVLDRSFTSPPILDHLWRNYDVPRVWSRRGIPKRIVPLAEEEGVMQFAREQQQHEMALAKVGVSQDTGGGGGKAPGSGRGDGTAKRRTSVGQYSGQAIYEETMRLLNNRPINGDARIVGKLNPQVQHHLLELVTQAHNQGASDADEN